MDLEKIGKKIKKIILFLHRQRSKTVLSSPLFPAIPYLLKAADREFSGHPTYRRWYAAVASASNASWSPSCARSTRPDDTRRTPGAVAGHLPRSRSMASPGVRSFTERPGFCWSVGQSDAREPVPLAPYPARAGSLTAQSPQVREPRPSSSAVFQGSGSTAPPQEPQGGGRAVPDAAHDPERARPHLRA